MGAVVLRTRLQNLYDWQPFTYHVTQRRSLPSLIWIHISWSFRFKHKAQTSFISLVHSLTAVDVAFKDIQDQFTSFFSLNTEP